MTKPLITERELAQLLHCTPRHIFNLRRRRIIPYVKLGGAIRYNADEVERAIQKLTVKERI
jgi:predicted DNA-binding transcriptional regulator AlpA